MNDPRERAPIPIAGFAIRGPDEALGRATVTIKPAGVVETELESLRRRVAELEQELQEATAEIARLRGTE